MKTRQAPFRYTWVIYPQYSRQKSKDVNCWVIVFSRTFTIIHSLLNHYKWNDPVTNYLRFCQLMRKTQRIYSCCIHATLISIVLHDLYFVFFILYFALVYFIFCVCEGGARACNGTDKEKAARPLCHQNPSPPNHPKHFIRHYFRPENPFPDKKDAQWPSLRAFCEDKLWARSCMVNNPIHKAY